MHQRLQGHLDVHGVKLVQLEVSGVSLPVADNYHRHLVWPRSARRANTAALACGARQATLALEGLQEKGFIDFDDALFVSVSMAAGSS